MQRQQAQSDIKRLKQEYVTYFEDVPVQKYAAMSINRDEDTIIRWKKEDQDFADAIQRKYAKWIRKRLIATKAEFALERLEKQIFSQSSRVEVANTTNAASGTSEERKETLRKEFAEFMRQKIRA